MMNIISKITVAFLFLWGQLAMATPQEQILQNIMKTISAKVGGIVANGAVIKTAKGESLSVKSLLSGNIKSFPDFDTTRRIKLIKSSA